MENSKNFKISENLLETTEFAQPENSKEDSDYNNEVESFQDEFLKPILVKNLEERVKNLEEFAEKATKCLSLIEKTLNSLDNRTRSQYDKMMRDIVLFGQIFPD